MKFKLSVTKYAEENSGEAAARRFSVDPKRVREKGEKIKLSFRKKASEEPEINMWE